MRPVDDIYPSARPDPDDLEIGALIGSWRVERELGRGGMGTVYAVRHAEIGKCAALKVVHREVLGGSYDADAFLTEARAVNAFSHPNVVDIFEAGTLADGRPYLLMERLRGRTLGDRHGESRVPALEAIEYLIPLCDALASAHAAGIVHRDIKLDNVFLADGRATAAGGGRAVTVKLLDWGVASITEAGKSSGDTLTIGTPRYVAPEQIKGEGVTSAADVYALGVMAYELFLEEPPFTATTTAELLLAHVNDPPPVPHEVWPKIPLALEELLLAMLSKRPAERPTAARVGAVLADVRDQLRARQSVALGAGARLPGREVADPTLALAAGRARPWRWLAVVALIAGVFGVRELVQGRHASVPSAVAEELARPAPAPTPAVAPPAPRAFRPAPARPERAAVRVVDDPRTTAHGRAAETTRAGARRASPAIAPRVSVGPATRARPAPSMHPDGLIDPY